MIAMLHIHSPWFALLFPVVAVGVFFALRRRPPGVLVSEVRSYELANRRPGPLHPVHLPVWIAGLGLCCLVAALMRPQKGVERLIEKTHGIDIMLVLDVSGSMQAYDVPPNLRTGEQVVEAIRSGRLKSRLDVAREELRRFVEKRPSDRIGLIAFARLPYTVCPPTLDHDYLVNHLVMLDAGSLPDGTGIAPAVASAVTRLEGSPAKRRVMVLFTDGENNVDAEITPLQAAKIAADKNIVIYTVGIGSNVAVMPVRTPFGTSLQLARAGLDEKLLREMAEATGGRYFRARDAAAFARVMQEIDSLEKVELKAPRYLDYRERFMPWLVAGSVLLLIAFLLRSTLCLAVP